VEGRSVEEGHEGKEVWSRGGRRRRVERIPGTAWGPEAWGPGPGVYRSDQVRAGHVYRGGSYYIDREEGEPPR
jgi:hypothetical protein